MNASKLLAEDYDELLPRSPLLQDETPFSTMMSSFDEAAFKLGIDPDAYAILRKPEREITVAVPVKLDDGSLAVFDGYRIQHNAGLGPFIGPLRLHKDVSRDELRALAGWMSWKCAVLNIPFGGSAGGINVDLRAQSVGEVERAVRRYTSNLLADIGPDRDIFSPDVATEEEVMAWIMDTVSTHLRYTESAVVTGKPVAIAGIAGHQDAVAQGMRVILRLAIEQEKLSSSGLKLMIQGAGTVGGHLARLLHQDGHMVCGLSDAHAAFYKDDGLDIPAILAWRDEHGSLFGYQGEFEAVTNEEMLSRPCDVFFPCAVPNAIHSRNAESVQARLIIEGAHGPVSARGDRILAERGITVVPDILANGGGVLVNYFEWVQNRMGFSWISPLIQKRLRRFMTEAWVEVVKLQKDQRVRMRMAANMLAVKKVAAADKLRGIYA